MNRTEKRLYIVWIFNNTLLTMSTAINAFSTESLIAKISFTVSLIVLLILVCGFVVIEWKSGRKKDDK